VFVYVRAGVVRFPNPYNFVCVTFPYTSSVCSVLDCF
jgi:hypothetical protein